MNQNYINTINVKDIDPNKSDHFLPKSQMYFGIKVLQELQKPLIFKNNALLDDFYSRTQNFLKITCLQIKKKYNFSDPVIPAIKLMDPRTALSSETKNEYNSLFHLMNLLPRITSGNEQLMQAVDSEWRTLPQSDIPSDIKDHLDKPDIFWYKLSYLKQTNDEVPFLNI